jgi:hypothetical protein
LIGDVLEAEELADVLLRITRLDFTELLRGEVELGELTRAKDV